jgi:hypothetical protein
MQLGQCERLTEKNRKETNRSIKVRGVTMEGKMKELYFGFGIAPQISNAFWSQIHS